MNTEQHNIALEVIKQVNLYFETNCTIQSKETDVVRPRMYAYKLIRDLTKMKLADIGLMFLRTHGAVIHGINNVEHDIENIRRYREYYVSLLGIIQSTDTYVNSSIGKKDSSNNLRVEIFNILAGKSDEELREMLKTINNGA
jgi:hypothetical protein